MTPGCIAVVRREGYLYAGRVVAVRAPAFAKIELLLPQGPQVVRAPLDDIAAVLHSRAADAHEVVNRVAAAQARAPQHQLAVAWQLLGEQPCGTGEVARLVCGDDDSVARDDVVLSAGLADDAFRLDRGQLLRRSEPERAALHTARARDAALQVQFGPWQQTLEQLRAGLRPPRPQVAEMGAQLQAWLTHPDQHNDVGDWLARHTVAPGHPAQTAAQWLAELGYWDAHDDAPLYQSGLLAGPPNAPPWLDPQLPATTPVSALQWLTLDNDAPHEIDDAIALTEDRDGLRLHVAIAHPTCWLVPGDPIDRAARRLGATLYHPRHVIGMLPDSLARGVAGLEVGQLRPALVFSARIDPHGQWSEPQVSEQWLTVAQAWQYRAVDAWLQGRPCAADQRALATQLWQLTQTMEQQRVRHGAWLLYKPEVDVRAPRHSPVAVLDASQSSPARRIVTEAMVLAGSVAAAFARDCQLAVPFRQQPPPNQPPHLPGYYSDPAEVFEVLRTLQPAVTALEAGPHALMGVAAYCQVTSPLRRYSDVLAHYQLVAQLRHTRPLPAAELKQALGEGEAAAGRVRHWQRLGDRYFKLLWLAGQRPGTVFDVQVVRTHAHGALLFLPGLALDVPVRSRRYTVGQWLPVEVQAVAPRQNHLELRSLA